MFDPAEEFGEFYGCFRLPPSLVRCDLTTLMSFPLQDPPTRRSTSLGGFCFSEDRWQTQVRMTIGVGKKAGRIRGGIGDFLSAAERRSDHFGLSVTALMDLGTVLGCTDPLLPVDASRLHAEQLYFVSRELTFALRAIDPDAVESLAAHWMRQIESTYAPAPPERSWSGGHMFYPLSQAGEELISHIDHDLLSDFLADLMDCAHAKHHRQVVFVSVTV